MASSDIASRDPELTTPTGKRELAGTEPLLLRRLGPFVFEVLDRERVVALQHLDAGAAVLGDRLPVLARRGCAARSSRVVASTE